MAREYYSLPEVAALLGLSRIAVFKRVKKGQLPALRIGRNWAVPAAFVSVPVPSAPPAQAPAAPALKPLSEAPPPDADAEMDSMGWD